MSLATIGSWIYLEGYQGEDEDKDEAAQKIMKNWGFEPFFTHRGKHRINVNIPFNNVIKVTVVCLEIRNSSNKIC